MKNVNDKLKGFNVREFYTSVYPDDELGADINPDLTLQEFYDVLKSGGNCYEALGVYDTIIRGVLIDVISTILEVDYEVIWDMWMDAKK